MLLYKTLTIFQSSDKTDLVVSACVSVSVGSIGAWSYLLCHFADITLNTKVLS